MTKEVVYDGYHKRITYTESASTGEIMRYDYLPRTYDVSAVKDADGNNPTLQWAEIYLDTFEETTPYTYWYHGCIEERDTYEIADYDNIDLSQALDLDIDRVPVSGDPASQWRPKFEGIGFARALDYDGEGAFSVAPVMDTEDDYVVPSWLDDLSSCPALAQKLAAMTDSDINTYLDTLAPAGKTYHDLGMIWGGRLLSPTGIFADENQNIDGMPTSRHMIFLTDGQTEPLDIVDGAYGIEPLDQRRWSPGSAISLQNTVEQRFAFACNEVKKRNITIWFVAFGTTLNPIFTNCAGVSRSFEAADSEELSGAFSQIAKNIGELRITR